MLDSKLLAQLKRRWHSLGTTMDQPMRPGLTDTEIDRIAAPLGFPLPEEVRRLYRWHDGSGRGTMIWGRGLYSLEQSVRSTLEFRADDDDWRPGWLNAMDEKPYVAFACDGDQDQPVPVWHYDYVSPPPTRPVFAGIGEMVAFWIELIDTNIMYWDTRAWKVRDLPQDVERKLLGVPADC